MLARRTRLACWLCLGLAALPAAAQDKKPAPALPTGTLRTEDWLKASTEPLAVGEIDRLVEAAQKKAGVTPAPVITDEQFIRRVCLDLTGRLPVPADVRDFLQDSRPD